MKPIWKDDPYVFYTDTLFTVWSLDSGGSKVSQIYSGRAVPNPTGEARVYMNRLVAEQLSQQLTTSSVEDVQYLGSFGLYDDTDTQLMSEDYYLDWSYEQAGFSGGLGLWVDMGGHPGGMPIIMTFEPGSYDLSVSGDINTYTFTTDTGANAYIGGQVGATSVTVTDSVSGTSRTIAQEPFCGRYALYFVNAYGGWSTLRLDGITTVEDALTRSTYDRDYDNGTPENRGRVNYRNTWERRYTLRTGWLSDEVSERMFHLFGSTLVYLYDSTESVFLPLVLTSNSYQHKTYRTNGRQMVSYDITATEAHRYARR